MSTAYQGYIQIIDIMTPEKSFNREINHILQEQPDSTAACTIRKVEQSKPNFKNHYALFDEFAFELGLGIVAHPVFNAKTDKLLGYIPIIKYYPNNKMGETPKEDNLDTYTTYKELNDCYAFLAKELLYRIMRITNLDELIASIKR